jgi:hypothetical protein
MPAPFFYSSRNIRIHHDLAQLVEGEHSPSPLPSPLKGEGT